MAVTLSDFTRKIIDGTNFGILGTVNPDGSPQTSPVWLTRDGDDVLVSTTVGRQKEKNLARDPRVSMTVFDPNNPYQYVEIRGHVTLTEEGAFELRDRLAQKYTGEAYKGDGPDAVRVVVRITPERVVGNVAG